MPPAPPRLARFAWGVLVYNLAVVAWGAFVRATGSGAGCGSHWPLCNGQVLPRPERVETLIELTHRLSSGLDGLLVAALAVWVWRASRRPASGVPRAAGVAGLASLGFLIVEALVGAGLVRFGLVEGNASTARAVVMAVHLVNTFLLLGCLALTAWWAGGGPPPRRRAGAPPRPGTRAAGWLAALGVAVLLALGVSGAVAALGDTLFPSTGFREGFRQDFVPGAHLLLRLRVFHPVIAVAAALGLGAAAAAIGRLRPEPAVRRWVVRFYALFAAQLVVGFVNLALAAPVALQLVHLVLADLVWIAWVLLGAATLGAGEQTVLRGAPDASPPVVSS
jgi:heme A synthase